MIRITVEMVPKGCEALKRTIGLMEISNVGRNRANKKLFDYQVLLKKTPPFSEALHANWRKGTMTEEDLEATAVEGFLGTKRGVYDLVFLALKACGLDTRNPLPKPAPAKAECTHRRLTQRCYVCDPSPPSILERLRDA